MQPYTLTSKEKFLLQSFYTKRTQYSADDLLTPFTLNYLTILRYLYENGRVAVPSIMKQNMYTCLYSSRDKSCEAMLDFVHNSLKCPWGPQFLLQCTEFRHWNAFYFAATQADCIEEMTANEGIHIKGLLQTLLNKGYFEQYKWLQKQHHEFLRQFPVYLENIEMTSIPHLLLDGWFLHHLERALPTNERRWQGKCVESFVLVDSTLIEHKRLRKIAMQHAGLYTDILQHFLLKMI